MCNLVHACLYFEDILNRKGKENQKGKNQKKFTDIPL